MKDNDAGGDVDCRQADTGGSWSVEDIDFVFFMSSK